MQEYLRNVRRELDWFREQEFLTESVAEVRQNLDKFFHVYSIMTANLGNCYVYRVRSCDEDRPHLETSDIWVPPSEVLVRVARANDIGERIFYGALHPMTAIKEAAITESKYFTLGVYHLRAMNEGDMPSVVIKTPPKPNHMVRPLEQLGHELSEFVESEFTKTINRENDHHYKKSCAMAQNLFNLPYKDSLLYPSVQDADMINIALPEAVAANRLTLKQVFHCQLRGWPYALSESRPLGEKLKTVTNKSPIGFRLNPIGDPMRFSLMFDHSKIESPDEMLRRAIQGSNAPKIS